MTMTLDDHLITIETFAGRSDNEFDSGGNSMVAAELLWGAMAHALIAVAEINGWRCEGHQGYREVARLLDNTVAQQRWRSDVGAAEQLHGHFYRSDLTTGELQSRRAATKFAIERLIPVIRNGIGGQGS